MITVFHLKEQSIISSTLSATDKLPENVIWVDLFHPTVEEEKSIEGQLGIEIPSKEEAWKNETLYRFYEENAVHYMTAAIITKVGTPFPQTSSVTFILAKHYLATIRYIAPTSFNNFSARLMRKPEKYKTAVHVLRGLLSEVILRIAHNSEQVVNGLDMLSHQIFGTEKSEEEQVIAENSLPVSQNMKNVLKGLGRYADLNSNINESMHSVQRLLHYFKQVHGGGKEMDNAIAVLISDINALQQQNAFLSDKITFLLDANLGMINAEQNMIIKIFSVVAVFFLPPTLVTGMYGMNFKHMPELEWGLGYPMAVVMMLLCAILPYLYFRRKKWL